MLSELKYEFLEKLGLLLHEYNAEIAIGSYMDRIEGVEIVLGAEWAKSSFALEDLGQDDYSGYRINYQTVRQNIDDLRKHERITALNLLMKNPRLVEAMEKYAKEQGYIKQGINNESNE
jgi:hypothetical protein